MSLVSISYYSSFDVQERDMAVWGTVRRAYKGVKKEADLGKELPNSHLGALLLTWIKQVQWQAAALYALL